MLSAVFQPEIDTLQFQIAQLQVQIAAAQERVKVLGEAESIADGAIQSLQTALEKVSTLAPSAIASLKSVVLGLFGGDDNSPEGVPAPEQLIATVPEASCNALPNTVGETQPALEVETTPEESEPSQAWELVSISDAVAYFVSPEREIGCTYAGFSNKNTAKRWGEWLAVHHSVANGFEVREAKRLTNFKHELKLWGMSAQQIERLAECDLRKNPLSNYGDAPKRLVEPVPPARPKIEVGDIVASTVVPAWQYEVLEVKGDGKLECRRLGVEPTLVVPQSEWAVNLVSKASESADEVASVEGKLPQEQTYPSIDAADVPPGVTLQSTNDDLLVEYSVLAWTIHRNKGVPEPMQRTIGRLVEGIDGIEAYKPKSGLSKVFGRTLDAVNYLINTSDYWTSDINAAVKLLNPPTVELTSTTDEQVEKLVEVSDRNLTECLATELKLELVEQTELEVFQVGDKVEIVSDRHGAELVGQVGKVTIANAVGCVVVIADQPRWFCTDEIVAAEDDLFPPKGWGMVRQPVSMAADDKVAF